MHTCGLSAFWLRGNRVTCNKESYRDKLRKIHRDLSRVMERKIRMETRQWKRRKRNRCIGKHCIQKLSARLGSSRNRGWTPWSGGNVCQGSNCRNPGRRKCQCANDVGQVGSGPFPLCRMWQMSCFFNVIIFCHESDDFTSSCCAFWCWPPKCVSKISSC